MIFVTGGMAQGKRDFAEKLVDCQGDWTDGSAVDWDTFMRAELCYNFHVFVRRVLERKTGPGWGDEGADCGFCRDNILWTSGELAALEGRLVENLYTGTQEKLLITDDIGCGIVPVDPFERMCREETGRICCRIAAGAEQVWRVCCGLGQRIK